MAMRRLLGLLGAVTIANGADSQERLGNYREACPDYVSYSSYPQYVSLLLGFGYRARTNVP